MISFAYLRFQQAYKAMTQRERELIKCWNEVSMQSNDMNDRNLVMTKTFEIYDELLESLKNLSLADKRLITSLYRELLSGKAAVGKLTKQNLDQLKVSYYF